MAVETNNDKARHLILTADERTWKFDRSVIFLGDWCKRYDRKEVWSTMDAIVAKPYGVETEQKDRDYAYVNRLKEEILVEISKFLNDYHKTNHSSRYWRILLGHWLHRYIATVYNRYCTLLQCLNSYKISSLTLFAEESTNLCGADSEQLIWDSQGEVWNNILFGKILSLQKNITLEIDRVGLDENATDLRQNISVKGAPHLRQRKPLKKRILQYFYGKLNAISETFSQANDAFIIKSYLPKKIEARLKLSLRQSPITWSSPRVSPSDPNREERNLLSEKYGNMGMEGFEQCVRTLFFQLLPVCYLEGYQDLLTRTKNLPWPSSPRFIFTSSSFDTDEVCKAYIAEKVESGSTYYAGQHGNNFGSYKYIYSEDECLATSDKFITWGWGNSNPKLVEGFNFIISNQKPLKNNPRGRLLLVEVHLPQPIEPWDVYPDYNKYQEDQFSFVEHLSGEIQQSLIVRLHHGFKMAPWFENLRWADRYPDIQVDQGVKNLSQWITESRLTVVSYNSTVILELLAMNVPVLCFWHSELNDIRENARPFFMKLVEAEILHFSPKAISQKTNEVWNNISEWWNSEVVQTARVLFCNHFSRRSMHPVKELKHILLENSRADYKRKAKVNPSN